LNEAVHEKIAAAIKDMPTLPSVAARIFSVTNDPEASVEKLRDIVSTDQVVAGRILRAVNSAYFGFPRQIDTLSKAIVILGFNNVRSIALSVSIMDLFQLKANGSFNIREMWIHGVGTAHCARALARIFYPRKSEQFFVAGLLHDIGLIAMNQCIPEEFEITVKNAISQKRPFWETEVEKFDFDHGDVGQYIADKWLLPAALSDAIGMHHRPQDATENLDIVYAIHAADIICKMNLFGDYGDNQPFTYSSIYQPASAMFKLSSNGPEGELAEALAQSLKEADEFIGIFK
jgi:HD-like signal output (HDOD) protein